MKGEPKTITVHPITLIFIAIGCVVATVLIALPSMIERTGDALVRVEIHKMRVIKSD